jgi:hypothetical protein
MQTVGPKRWRRPHNWALSCCNIRPFPNGWTRGRGRLRDRQGTEANKKIIRLTAFLPSRIEDRIGAIGPNSASAVIQRSASSAIERCLPTFVRTPKVAGRIGGNYRARSEQQRYFEPESGGLFPVRVGAVHPPVHYRQRQSGRMSFATFVVKLARAEVVAKLLPAAGRSI